MNWKNGGRPEEILERMRRNMQSSNRRTGRRISKTIIESLPNVKRPNDCNSYDCEYYQKGQNLYPCKLNNLKWTSDECPMKTTSLPE
jgi:hypothetical protein